MFGFPDEKMAFYFAASVIYTPCSGLHITHFSAVVAMKWKNFEQIFRADSR